MDNTNKVPNDKNEVLNSPHDLLCKSFLSDIEVAKTFIRSFLPKHILELCNLDSVKIESNDFIFYYCMIC